MNATEQLKNLKEQQALLEQQIKNDENLLRNEKLLNDAISHAKNTLTVEANTKEKENNALNKFYKDLLNVKGIDANDITLINTPTTFSKNPYYYKYLENGKEEKTNLDSITTEVNVVSLMYKNYNILLEEIWSGGYNQRLKGYKFNYSTSTYKDYGVRSLTKASTLVTKVNELIEINTRKENNENKQANANKLAIKYFNEKFPDAEIKLDYDYRRNSNYKYYIVVVKINEDIKLQYNITFSNNEDMILTTPKFTSTKLNEIKKDPIALVNLLSKL